MVVLTLVVEQVVQKDILALQVAKVQVLQVVQESALFVIKYNKTLFGGFLVCSLWYYK
jgi:hypothetical protein